MNTEESVKVIDFEFKLHRIHSREECAIMLMQLEYLIKKIDYAIYFYDYDEITGECTNVRKGTLVDSEPQKYEPFTIVITWYINKNYANLDIDRTVNRIIKSSRAKLNESMLISLRDEKLNEPMVTVDCRARSWSDDDICGDTTGLNQVIEATRIVATEYCGRYNELKEG